MAYKLEIEEVLEEEGFDTIEELLDDYKDQSLVPSMCSCGAMVEPDGHCEHGNPSVFLEYGLV